MKIQILCASAHARLPAELGQPTVSGYGWAIFATVEEAAAKKFLRTVKNVRKLGDSFLVTL